MGIKKIITGLTLTMLLGSGLAVAANQDSVPYKRGDCILGIEPSYSWANHFARVEAYGSIGDLEGENYVLLFFTYQPKNVIFSRSIEANTVKVPSKYCDR
ncbi:hypothetical protein N8222_05710 [Oceanospirillaceae bacterium]|nr:hypothetical protein [Oceanospirillaceae bacterium]